MLELPVVAARGLPAFGSMLAIAFSLSACSTSSRGEGADASTEPAVDGAAPQPRSCEPGPERCADGDGARPGRLSEHTAVYDPERLEMIVFGGTDTIPRACAFGGAVNFRAETFVYDDVCGTWQRVEGDSPSASGRHMAAFGDGQVWVFGGRFRDSELESGPYDLYADLFAFEVATRTWYGVETEGERPAPRVNGVLIWDDQRERLWLFGGNTSPDGAIYQPQNDLWSFDPARGRWQRHEAAGEPPAPRLFAAGLHDATRDALVVYGGADESGFAQDARYFGDVWSLSLSSLRWQRLHAGGEGAPEGRFWAGLVHELRADRYLMFGGHDDQRLGNRNDAWHFDPERRRWTRLLLGDEWNAPARDVCNFPPDFAAIDGRAPERRNAHSLVYSEACGHALLFGGKTDCGAIDDVWTFDGERFRQRVAAREGEVCLRWREEPNECGDLCF